MHRTHCRALAIALAALLAVAPADAQTIATWNFNDLPNSLPTPFSQTKNGVTADFTAVVGPANGFSIGASFFQLLSGNVLFSADANGNDLGIAFSSAVDSLDVTFAMNSQDITTPFTVQTFLGLNPVATTNTFGFIASSGFLEGIFATSGSLFDRVLISTGAPDFAIDNLNVRTAAVPEPGSLLLLSAGLGVLAASRRRRAAERAADRAQLTPRG